MPYNLITILGPTATGKTLLASKLADHYCGEIISADSRQVYKGMDLGTGKDLTDYVINGKMIKYHIIDIMEPTEEFNLFQFRQHFKNSFQEIRNKRKIPFLVGGTGMYLSSIIQNYNLKISDRSKDKIYELNSYSNDELVKILKSTKKNLHNTTDLTDRNRVIEAILIATSDRSDDTLPAITSFNIGVNLSREEIKNRITQRLKKRFDEGMVDEVKILLKKGITYEKMMFFGLEYKYITLYLNGKLNYNDMFQKLNSAIHKFAKKQMTWFRKMEKEGVEIFWIDGNDFNQAKHLIDEKYLYQIK